VATSEEVPTPPEPPAEALPVPIATNGALRRRWLALRDGAVVADADTLEELSVDERVQPGDRLCGTYFY
jgi:hypothetical protein